MKEKTREPGKTNERLGNGINQCSEEVLHANAASRFVISLQEVGSTATSVHVLLIRAIDQPYLFSLTFSL